MNVHYLKTVIAVTAVVLFVGISARAEEMADVRRVSGEIGWVDVQSGELNLNRETPTGTEVTGYRITQNETRVTDPMDQKFLNVGDLRAGQNVTLEVVNGQADKVVSTIIVDPMPASEFQQSFGRLKSIDVPAGTFVIEERVRIGQEEVIRSSDFVFEPTIVAMRSPSKQPVELVLVPGDVVKVDFVAVDGKKHARYITLYAPAVTRTTTTVTTTTATIE